MAEVLRRVPEPVIERASPTDRAFLAMDTDEVPEQFGVLLLLEGSAGPGLEQVRGLVAERIGAVPRLRQRLVPAGLGRGGPIWTDHPGFDIARHVRSRSCRAPADRQGVLDAALAVVTERLPVSEPLWSVVLLTGVADGATALVVVMNHALADGVGGLAVLASLVDEGARPTGPWSPRPRPSGPALFADALRARWRALRGTVTAARLLRTSFGAAGGLRAPPVEPCSLVQRTGSRRAIAAVSCDRATLRAAAHARGATTNDAVLVAVAGALRQVLAGRGERVDVLAFTVPVSGRQSADASSLGNAVSPMIVLVPVAGSVDDRLRRVADQVRAHRAAATGPPPIAVLGAAFRLLARLGGYRWYMNHQRRMHSLVSHVRGPDQPLTFGGHRIVSAVPIGVSGGGNITVTFEVLSYAGRLTVTAIVDADHFPDLHALEAALRTELDSLATPVSGGSGPRPGVAAP